MERKRFQFDLNTSSNCFLCFKEIEGNAIKRKLFSLRNIFSYLKIPLDNLKLVNKSEVRVKLCGGCGKTLETFSELYKTLEVIKMKLDYNMELIQGKIVKSVENNLLEEFYMKIKERGEGGALQHFGVVRELRSEVLQKSKTVLAKRLANVNLSKLEGSELINTKGKELSGFTTSDGDDVKQEIFSEDEDSPGDFYEAEEESSPSQPGAQQEMHSNTPSGSHPQKSCRPHPPIKYFSDPTTGKYRCPFPSCSKEFNTKNACKQHVYNKHRLINPDSRKRRTGPKRYSCPDPNCARKFHISHSASRHYRSVHLQIRYKCDNCEAKFTQKNNLRKHKISCKEIKQEESPEMDSSSIPNSKRLQKSQRPRSRDKSNLHTDSTSPPRAKMGRKGKPYSFVGKKNSDGVMTYACPDSTCPRQYNHYLSVQRHYESIHLQIRHKCDHCEAQFTEKSCLKRHKTASACAIRKNAPPGTVQPKQFDLDETTGKYKCPEVSCQSQFLTRGGVKVHFRSVHLKIRYKCDNCSRDNFSYASQLSQHKQKCYKSILKVKDAPGPEDTEQGLPTLLDSSQDVICHLCGKGFDCKISFQRHRLRVHDSVDRWPCDLCEKKFKKGAHLRRHKDSIHFGKTFSCRFCKKDYTREYVVRSHEKKCQQTS